MTTLEILYLGWIVNFVSLIISVLILTAIFIIQATKDPTEFHKFAQWNRDQPIYWKQLLLIGIPFALLAERVYLFYKLTTTTLPLFEFIRDYVKQFK